MMPSSKERNPFVQFIANFFSSSSIHGFNHLTTKRRHPIEIILWLLLISIAVSGVVHISKITLDRYRTNPTVISMERDRFAWNTTFPAATICPYAKFDENILEEYIKYSTASNKTELREFLIALSHAKYDNLDKIPHYDAITSDEYLPLLLDLHKEFKYAILSSDFDLSRYKLTMVITEMGICYTFNSQLALYKSPDYWESNRWDIIEETEIYKSNPLNGEALLNMFNLSSGFDVYFHGSHEVPDITTKPVLVETGYFLRIYMTALTIYSSERARELRIGQRKCRLHTESNLRHYPAYSYVLCRIDCRANLAKRLCGCLPHFYRKTVGDRICDVDGLHCLGHHKERLLTVDRSCSCLPNCDEVNYIFDEQDYHTYFIGTTFQWGIKDYPRMRLKRDILFGFTDMLVYIGGIAGLFLGCSVLSFIEFIYYFTMRLFWFLIDIEKKPKIIMNVNDDKS